MSISNYAELKILDHLTGTASWTAPSGVYLQLHTGDPGETGANNGASESTRKVATWGSASSGSITISAEVEWTNVAATETYTHWSLWDASSGGNCLFYGALSSSSVMTAGDSFKFTSLTLSLD